MGPLNSKSNDLKITDTKRTNKSTCEQKFIVINFQIPPLSKGSSRGSLGPLPRHGISATRLPRAVSSEYKIEFGF